MSPTFSDGELHFFNKNIDLLENGDIVLIKMQNSKIVKRIAAVENDEIEILNSELFINGVYICEAHECSNVKYKLKKNTFFVLGDNLQNSEDSRKIGVINEENIIGELVKYN